jgi:hypothetical protein
MASDIDVVVFDKHELIRESVISHQLGNLSQDVFARTVVRMGLTGKHELNRPLGVIDHRGKDFHILQDHVRALVCRESSCKTDRQRIRTQGA